ncbi:MAG: hypothetical protein JRJ85_08110, partial [Deltaproteobacteria bacterium]|nr:hypothetical protein [Deltaproteobacteria bacterium]
MNKLQFTMAIAIANSYNGLNGDFDIKKLEIFDGFALDTFEPVEVTIYDVAKLIKFMCWRSDRSYIKSVLHIINI